MPYLGVKPAAEFTSNDLNGAQLILDADADTTITADTDDQIDIRIAGADDFQFTANTFTAQSGSTIAAQAVTATTITPSGQLICSDGSVSAPSITFEADLNTGLYHDDGDSGVIRVAMDGTERQLWTNGGMVALSDTSNANMSTGITINQGAADNIIIALKSSDVAHGMTGQLETDSYGHITKAQAASGGVSLIGATEGTQGVRIRPYVTTEDTTKGSTGQSACEIYGVVKSGISLDTLSGNVNALGVLGTSGHTQFIVDSDGDVHYDGTTNAGAWDDYDDVELLDTFRSLTITDKDAAKNISFR